MLNAWLNFTNNTFPSPTFIEEILDQPLFLNPHTKIPHHSDNPYFYCLPPQNISDKFWTIRDICRFLQPGLISSETFREKLDIPNINHNNIYKKIVELIPKNWLRLLKTETSQQSLFKVFYFNCKGIEKIKNLQKISNKDIYFTLQNKNKNLNTDPSNLFRGQTTLMKILLLPLVTGAKYLLIGLKNAQMVIFSLSGIN